MSARTSSLSEHLKYSHMLAKLLAGAWNTETGAVTQRIESAVDDGDTKAILKELKALQDWSEGVKKKLAKKIAAVVLLTQERARQYWWKERSRYTRSKGMSGPDAKRSKAEDDDEDEEGGEDAKGNNAIVSRNEPYQDRVRRLHAEQLTELARRYPERILSPEIEKLIDFMGNYDTLSETELTRIQTRVKSIIHPDAYWQSLSHVHAARLWHSTGVDMAKAKGVREMQVVGIWDKRTCPVCKIMIGQVVRVEQIAERLEASLGVDDPDEYVAAWRFPRFNEIQLLDPDALTARGDIPPFHPRCRCSMVWYR